MHSHKHTLFCVNTKANQNIREGERERERERERENERGGEWVLGLLEAILLNCFDLGDAAK